MAVRGDCLDMGGLWDYCGIQNAAATAPHHSDRNSTIMRKTLIPAIAAALLLTGCSEHSGHGEARDAGIPISYSDYHDMCDVHSGEVVRGMDIDRTWTSAQDRELRQVIADDPNCQPDYEDTSAASVENSTVAAAEATTPAREMKGSTEDDPWGPLEGTLLEQMQVRGIQTGNMTADVAVSLGESLCRGADGGISHARLLEIVQDHMDGWDLADSILYIELSFENLCPEHATL